MRSCPLTYLSLFLPLLLIKPPKCSIGTTTAQHHANLRALIPNPFYRSDRSAVVRFMYRYRPHTQRGQHTHTHTAINQIAPPACHGYTHTTIVHRTHARTLYRTISSLFAIRQLRVYPCLYAIHPESAQRLPIRMYIEHVLGALHPSRALHAQ